jgi:protein ImuB
LAQPQPLAHLFEAQPWVLHDGPERIESGWWDGGDVRRDYFVARSPAGETAWIYRDHRYGTDDGEWFLHGWFA